MEFYSSNAELVQCLVGIFGLGVGAIVWCIFFCSR